MAVYHRLRETDLLYTVLGTYPLVTAASGSSGWRGNLGPSASLSMYGGPRSRIQAGISIRPSYPLDTHTIDGASTASGSYPATGSIRLIKVCAAELPARDSQNWGREHFEPIVSLHEHYGRYWPEYTTASYDFYSVFLANSSSNILAAAYDPSAATTPDALSASFTIEAVVKPFTTSSVVPAGSRTIVSRTQHFTFCLTGSDSRLAFVTANGVVHTASRGPTQQRWSHCAVRFENGTGSFTIDLLDAGTFLASASNHFSASVAPVLCIGGRFSGSLLSASWTRQLPAGNLSGQVELANAASFGHPHHSFHGLFGDVRIWKGRRTDLQLSQSFDSTFRSTGSDTSLISYARVNQGPLAGFSGVTSGSSLVYSAALSDGSGALDYSRSTNHYHLGRFDSRFGPVWQPNDNPRFIVDKVTVDATVPRMRIVHIPSLFYGRGIATGSVEITCRAYTGLGLLRKIVDDGRGGLYISGSLCSSSLADQEDYTGVRWNKVGRVFYSEGIIAINDPSLWDIGEYVGGTTLHPEDVFSLSFRATNPIPTKVVMCRLDQGEGNASNNSTFTVLSPTTGKLQIRDRRPVTYITAVGIYNSDRKLVAVAKLAQPLRKREKDSYNVRLKMDF